MRGMVVKLTHNRCTRRSTWRPFSGPREATYRSAVDELVPWCHQTFLQLDLTKTAGLVIDFRLSKPSPDPLITTVTRGQNRVPVQVPGNGDLQQTEWGLRTWPMLEEGVSHTHSLLSSPWARYRCALLMHLCMVAL